MRVVSNGRTCGIYTATTESGDTTTVAELTTTVTDDDSLPATDELTTVTDSETQTGMYMDIAVCTSFLQYCCGLLIIVRFFLNKHTNTEMIIVN